ncbi:MAG TPA: cytochrome c-type biogenesis protein CcmH [Acidimicrobiales bacterium]|nr:cytochrome c-type biogenesis protein CcmH [Acidimicrobiales bacterium]
MSRVGAPSLRTGLWVVLVVMVGVALGVGASRGSGPTDPRQQADALDAVLRCPSCDGISVAQSSASTAQAIRQAVLARARAGQSDGRIESYLESRYGPGILLRPPVAGATAWVWVAPPVALAAGAGALAVVFWRRRRRRLPDVTDEERRLVEAALRDRSPVPGTPPAPVPS